MSNVNWFAVAVICIIVAIFIGLLIEELVPAYWKHKERMEALKNQPPQREDNV